MACGADLSAVVTGVGRPNGVAYGAGAVWITDSADDCCSGSTRPGRSSTAFRSATDRLACGRPMARSGWRTSSTAPFLRSIRAPDTQVAMIPAGIGPDAIAFGYGSVWVANVTSDTLSRIDAVTGKVVVDHSSRRFPDRHRGRRRRSLGDQPGDRRATARRPGQQPAFPGDRDRLEPGRPGRRRG